MCALIARPGHGFEGTSAQEWNRLFDTVRRLQTAVFGGQGVTGIDSPAGRVVWNKRERPLAPPRPIRFIVESGDEYPDTILCRRSEGGAADIHVAKPYLLRRTPWNDGQERGEFRYEYVSNVERDSIRVADETDKERQVVTPSFERGDVIYAVLYGYSEADDLRAEAGSETRLQTPWLATIYDAREWAKKSG